MQTFKQYLIEKTQLNTLAKKIGVSVAELEGISKTELKTILKDIGKHDLAPIKNFNKRELKKGIKAEKEHTNSDLIATLIAKDHLSELPNYYTKLSKMEEKG